MVALLVGVLLTGCAGTSSVLPVARTSSAVSAPGSAARPGPGGTANPRPKAAAPQLAVDAERQHDEVASGGPAAPYNYAPSVLREGGTYQMWWCSQLPGVQPPGDDILYAASPLLDGPFTAPDGSPASVAFHGDSDGFDAMHTCDPSVLRVGGTYYLYYTGSAGDRDYGNSIGVATSTDGMHFDRVNHGQPIVVPSKDIQRDNNTYGVGQPSVIFLDGWFYLMFTDTTGAAAALNGEGQFVLRASDPTFQNNVQTLSDSGFHPVGGTLARRERSIVDAFSADWMWVDALKAFAVAHETTAGTTITFWDKDFTGNPYQPVELPGVWQEGPGLVRGPDGHAPVSSSDPCGRVPFDVIRATRDVASPTGLAHFGVDVHGIDGCASGSQALTLLDGYGIPSPQRTVDLVVDGSVVEVERRSVTEELAKRILDQPVPALWWLPVTARIPAGTRALWAPERPVALLGSDGRLWPVSSVSVAQANASQIDTVTAAEWDAHPRGVDLSSLRG